MTGATATEGPPRRRRFWDGMARRAHDWSRRRIGVDRFPITLARNRVYILPTGLGFTYAAMLFAMLLAGLNYANNLALILTFVLTASGWVAMHECHRNLVGLKVATGATASPYAGSPAHFTFQLSAEDGRARYDLALSARGALGTTLSIAPGEVTCADLSVPTRVRGRVSLARARIESRFPLGLCRAWTWLHGEQVSIVYPRPSLEVPTPRDGAGEPGGSDARLACGDEDYTGLRDYRPGDALRRLAWKAYARGGDLLVKELGQEAALPVVFDLDAIAGRDLEERIARLTRLVVDAAARGDAYGLKVDEQRIDAARGAAHRHRCLAALAGYRSPDPGPPSHAVAH